LQSIKVTVLELKGMKLYMFGLGEDIGIDLGTASVLIYVKSKGVVLVEPSVIAMDTSTKTLLAVGTEAQRMLGRTPGNIVTIRPLRDGVISNYNMTQRMLRHFLDKICKRRIFKPRVIICVPSGVTEVEKRAVVDASLQAGASKTFLIEEPIAAAIGAGIDISKPCGNMIVDIGGGTTDVAVISLGGIVVSNSIKTAGDKFDEAIIKYIRKKHNILIGERTAEDMKIKIGCVYKDASEPYQSKTIDIRGRSLVSGLPKTVSVTSDEMYDAFEEPAIAIVEAIKMVLENTPPELVGDISTHGIVMTGGGSLVEGLNRLISKETGIDASIAENAISCVAIGTGKALEDIGILRESK
jgi:rod shape-determining protein MreB